MESFQVLLFESFEIFLKSPHFEESHEVSWIFFKSPEFQTKPIKSAKYALLVLQATVKICNLVFKSSNDKYSSGKESVI